MSDIAVGVFAVVGIKHLGATVVECISDEPVVKET